MSDLPVPATFGLVLAGGLARRMGGGDKARIKIGGVTILDSVLATLSGQVQGMVINANGDPARFADTGLDVVADSVPDFAGPLAGILAGLDYLAAQDNGIEWLLSVPGDCPFLPDDLVERLHRARRRSCDRQEFRSEQTHRRCRVAGRPSRCIFTDVRGPACVAVWLRNRENRRPNPGLPCLRSSRQRALCSNHHQRCSDAG